RYDPDNRLAQWLAPLFVLFLPVGFYTAPMLGNEGLNTVLCSAALYFLLRTLQQPDWRQPALLGLTLGLALMTKATAAAVAAAAVITLALWTLRTRQWRLGTRSLALTLAVTALVCGWYYGRNVMHFGTPFAMSRPYLVVAHVENAFPQGQRGFSAYLGFDPRILENPRYVEGPVINSVWTGMFAGTWFEVVGGNLMPSVLSDAGARWAGRLLIALGIVPTLMVLLGVATAIWRLIRTGWDNVLVTMLTAFGCMLALFVAFTLRVSTFTAVKPSYLMPVVVPFSFWFALGCGALARWRRLLIGVLAECGLLLAVIVPVFTYQLMFTAELTGFYFNALGGLYYFAGRTQAAREIFTAVADGYHLYTGHENLAAVALEEGKPDEALRHLEQAAQLAPEQIFGAGEDYSRLLQLDLAEYACTTAYIQHLRGR
ncbi:MAG: tetratricopeptide repeat protein, partial [Nevskiales bacterium]